LGKDVVKYLADTQAEIQSEFDELGKSSEYSIGVEYKLVLTKNPGEADIVLNAGSDGKSGAVVHVAKDSSSTHPFRQKDLVVEVNKKLNGAKTINSYDIQCINRKHKVKSKPEWFYQGKVAGSPAQYSNAFIHWVIERFRQDKNFFVKARKAVK
jgi:hypothetical protein